MAIEKFNKNMAIIAALDDEPNDVGGMTSAELKDKFDEGGKALQSYMNETLIPALENLGVETAVLLPENEAGFKYIRLNADKVLEVSMDGNVWQATGSSGHLIIGPDGQALPQRSRMQFTNGTVTDQNGVTVVTGPDGKSAYQTAVEAGYSGTETAFNTALKDVPGHIGNSDIHVTAAQKTAWDGAVRYDTPQSLSDAQMEQARKNINAALGGFGLGIPASLANGDVNERHGNGFYEWGSVKPKNAPTLLRDEGTYMYMFEFGDADGFTQIVGCYISSSPGLIYQQAFSASGGGLTFSGWKWLIK